MSPAIESKSSTTGPPGKSQKRFLFILVAGVVLLRKGNHKVGELIRFPLFFLDVRKSGTNFVVYY